jgi:hypothetical protein
VKIILLFSLILLVACGDQASSSKKTEGAVILEDNLPLKGKYRLMLRPINSQFLRVVSGSADIEVKDQTLSVNLIIDDAADVIHFQSIHTAQECPVQNDENGDSFVDINEAQAKAGEVLLPLNNTIDPEVGFQGTFPLGVSYSYQKEVDIQPLEASLSTEGKELKLANKVVLIYGAPISAELPASVASLPGSSPQASLPIACGIIERVHYNEGN